jgi:hypothetical protein
MKNHKGTVATLLTLGLVLVGSLVTLGVSFLTNNNKQIASSPRAQAAEMPTCTAFYENMGDVTVSGSGCAPACGGEDNCRECKFAGDIKYECSNIGELNPCVKARTYSSKSNCVGEHTSDGNELCTQCKVSDTPRWEYGGSGPGGGNVNVPGTTYAFCPYITKDLCINSDCDEKKCVNTNCEFHDTFRCTTQQAGTDCKTTTNCSDKTLFPDQNYSQSVLISINKKGEYFASAACFEGTKVANLNALGEYCYDQSSSAASQPCVYDNICDENLK